MNGHLDVVKVCTDSIGGRQQPFESSFQRLDCMTIAVELLLRQLVRQQVKVVSIEVLSQSKFSYGVL